ncbi:hypothetical protein C8Q75DRAFT_581223 [Abortiporus biennis]|nr:hypothetical protein C8Q75DRAFT_581223 [Abortiporus biennis]
MSTASNSNQISRDQTPLSLEKRHVQFLSDRLNFVYGLPVELIVRVLEELSFHELVLCRELSHYFKEVIDTSPSLQYSIQLVLCGMEDVPCRHKYLSRTEKLAILHEYHTRINTLPQDPSSFIETTLSRHGLRVWDGIIYHETEQLTGTVGDHAQTSKSELILDSPPSFCLGTKNTQWKLDLHVRLDWIAVDVAQDLFVYLDVDDENGACLRCLSLSTLKPHPNASKEPITILLPTYVDTAGTWSDMTICESHIGIICGNYDHAEEADRFTFTILDWTRGSEMLYFKTGYDTASFEIHRSKPCHLISSIRRLF